MSPIQWVAVYSDGTSLRQYNADGSENRYPSIDRSKLASFALEQEGRTIIRYHFDHPDQRLIFRRRVFLIPGAPEPVVFFLIGWQRNVGAEKVNIQSISVVALRDNVAHIEVIGRWGGHALFEAVEPIDCEKDPEQQEPLLLS